MSAFAGGHVQLRGSPLAARTIFSTVCMQEACEAVAPNAPSTYLCVVALSEPAPSCVLGLVSCLAWVPSALSPFEALQGVHYPPRLVAALLLEPVLMALQIFSGAACGLQHR
eukprot:CAMPEP_0171162868 /NCGR_PEP_ID=MMETSP0790-20130122/4822_1 /TAXON_ID=2925 /ORGANISM="Alexandrium catenella, Strain OF101" /LENGTH=111 /DNA_ID=CAMNT_0011627501 /DNA_START=209 /DNA_END=545 /DNA_ORIENTATION=-